MSIKNLQKVSGKGGDNPMSTSKESFLWNSVPRKTKRVDSIFFYFLFFFWFYYNRNTFLFQTILLFFCLSPKVWRLKMDKICLASSSFPPNFRPWSPFPLWFPLQMSQRHRTWALQRQRFWLFPVSPIPSEVSGAKMAFHHLKIMQ